MSRWVCPRCEREFGAVHQAHTCVPGGTVDESFARAPAGQREVYDALRRHIDELGPVHEDAVGVGVFLKRERKFAEVRPMARALSINLVMPYPVDHPLVWRHLSMPAGRVLHVIRVRQAGQLDDGILEMVTTAYLAAG